MNNGIPKCENCGMELADIIIEPQRPFQLGWNKYSQEWNYLESSSMTARCPSCREEINGVKVTKKGTNWIAAQALASPIFQNGSPACPHCGSTRFELVYREWVRYSFDEKGWGGYSIEEREASPVLELYCACCEKQLLVTSETREYFKWN